MNPTQALALAAALFVPMSFARAQDAPPQRPKFVLELAAGRTWFTTTGDDHQYFDTFGSRSTALQGGASVRIPISKLFGFRLGLLGGARSFKSSTYDYRTPIWSGQNPYSGPNVEEVELTYVASIIGFQVTPVRWATIVIGGQFMWATKMTIRPHGFEFPFNAGAEAVVGVDLWLTQRLGVLVRYQHPLEDVRQQQVAFWPAVYTRNTRWLTAQVGVQVNLSRREDRP